MICGGIWVNMQIPDIILLLFADDVAILTNTVVKLQRYGNVVMCVNIGKTEIARFIRTLHRSINLPVCLTLNCRGPKLASLATNWINCIVRI
jgi:hypothetical protein